MSLGRIAAARAAPVYAVVGADARTAIETLHTDDRIELCDSPRHAAVLLVAGALRGKRPA